jgi:N utilization substance protein B
MTRRQKHKSRRFAFQVLYQYELRLSDETRMEDLEEFFQHFAVPEALQARVGSLVLGAWSHREACDAWISKAAKKWRLERMHAVEKSLLRLGTYELAFGEAIDAPIVIDEAVELAKKFGSQDTPKFVNGILDQVAQWIRTEKG